ncbi:hypothetical protein ACFY0G_13910 [Streptomyces sp. NPDC001552]|uniref:hypothetical protein n=1 Tax=Streptomyces sp. NPDC001552 TaxID=3364587 RepID=UPI0036BEC345
MTLVWRAWHLRLAPGVERLGLTCMFFRRHARDAFAMTHHVECVAILEPIAKGA